MKREQGQVLVLVAMTLPLLLTFVLFVTGYGQAVVERAQAQNAVDAAALAGAEEALVGPPGAAQAEARAYVDGNGWDGAAATVSGPDAEGCVTVSVTKVLNLIRPVTVGADAVACPDDHGRVRLTK